MDRTEDVRDFWTGLLCFIGISVIQIVALTASVITNLQGIALMTLIAALFVATVRSWSPKVANPTTISLPTKDEPSNCKTPT